MRHLKEYIKDELMRPDYIDEQLHNHFYVSCVFDPVNLYGTGHLLFEGSGIFDGCSDMVDKIVTDIYGDQEQLEFTLHTRRVYKYADFKLKEHFFDKLVIVLSEEKGDDSQSDYKYNDADWDGERLSSGEIIVYDIYNIDMTDFAGILTHELTHMHDNYLAHQILNSDINTDNDDKVKVLLRKLRRLKRKFDKDKDNEDLKTEIANTEFIKNAYYYLDEYEINAFISELSTLIKKETFENSREYLYKIRQMESYQIYREFYEISLMSNGPFSELNIDKKDVKMFRKQAQRAWKKLINHTYLAYVEQVEEMIEDHLIAIGQKCRKSWLYHFDSSIPVWKRTRDNART